MLLRHMMTMMTTWTMKMIFAERLLYVHQRITRCWHAHCMMQVGWQTLSCMAPATFFMRFTWLPPFHDIAAHRLYAC